MLLYPVVLAISHRDLAAFAGDAPNPTKVGGARWTATLVALSTVGALSIDMSLPAQPVLAREFGATTDAAQATLSVFFAGYGIAQLIVGALSDALGRRRVLIGGLGLFLLASIACAISTSMAMLIACRALQGVAAASAPVVARAMVRDVQSPAQAARKLSTMLAAVAVAPMLAPSIGTALLAACGWRAIFATLSLCCAALLVIAYATLGETLPAERRVALSVRGLAGGYLRLFAARGTRVPMLVLCTAFAGQFAYISASPFVYLAGFHVGPTAYACCLAATSVALMLGSLTGRKLLANGRAPTALIATGTTVLLAGAALLAVTHSLGVAGFLVPVAIYFFGCGMTSPSATSLVLAPVPQLAGTASAAIGFLTTMAGAFAGYETTRVGGASPAAPVIVVIAMAVVTAGLAWTLVSRHARPRCPGIKTSRSARSGSAAIAT